MKSHQQREFSSLTTRPRVGFSLSFHERISVLHCRENSIEVCNCFFDAWSTKQLVANPDISVQTFSNLQRKRTALLNKNAPTRKRKMLRLERFHVGIKTSWAFKRMGTIIVMQTLHFDSFGWTLDFYLRTISDGKAFMKAKARNANAGLSGNVKHRLLDNGWSINVAACLRMLSYILPPELC